MDLNFSSVATVRTCVILSDRFWHSTAAYAIAEEGSIPQDSDHWVYRWPRNLFRPTVVILLVVDEELRLQRLQNRVLTEGTVETNEERILAGDGRRRQRCASHSLQHKEFKQR
jgi:thymidylate kinase